MSFQKRMYLSYGQVMSSMLESKDKKVNIKISDAFSNFIR